MERIDLWYPSRRREYRSCFPENIPRISSEATISVSELLGSESTCTAKLVTTNSSLKWMRVTTLELVKLSNLDLTEQSSLLRQRNRKQYTNTY